MTKMIIIGVDIPYDEIVNLSNALKNIGTHLGYEFVVTNIKDIWSFEKEDMIIALTGKP